MIILLEHTFIVYPWRWNCLCQWLEIADYSMDLLLQHIDIIDRMYRQIYNVRLRVFNED